MQEVVGSTPISSTKNQPPSPSNKGLWFLRGIRSFDELYHFKNDGKSIV
jgi:hypothetical protein